MYKIISPEIDFNYVTYILIAILLTIPTFSIYYFICNHKNTASKLNHSNNLLLLNHAYQKITGFVLFGIIPGLIMLVLNFNLLELGLKSTFNKEFIIYYLPLAFIIISITYLTASKPVNQAIYPQLRTETWTPSILIFNAICWGFYLLGYEFLFRGILLFMCLPKLGLIYTIILNTALYSLVHIPKGIREVIGSIPLGVLFCLISIQTKSIWVPFFVHLTLAISNDFWSVHYNKKMSFCWRFTDLK